MGCVHCEQSHLVHLLCDIYELILNKLYISAVLQIWFQRSGVGVNCRSSSHFVDGMNVAESL